MTLNIHQMSIAWLLHTMHIVYMFVNPLEILEQKLSVKKWKIHLNKINNIYSNISGGNRLALTSL